MTSARPPYAPTGMPPPTILPRRREIGLHARQSLLRTAVGEAKTGHHLVENQKRPVPPAEPLGRFEKSGLGQHHAHVADDRFEDHAGDLVPVTGERLFQPLRIVEFECERVGRAACGDSRRRGRAVRQGSAACFHQQAVDVAVVAAGEFHDPIATCKTTSHADRAHRGFGPRADHPHLFNRGDRLDDHLGEFRLGFGRRTEARPLGQSRLDGGDNVGMSVAEDQGAPRADVIDQAIAVDVDEIRSLAPLDEEGFAANGAEGAGGAVHPARDHALCPFKIGPALLTLHWPLDASALLKSPAAAMKNRLGSMRCRMTEITPSDVNSLICFSRFE